MPDFITDDIEISTDDSDEGNSDIENHDEWNFNEKE